MKENNEITNEETNSLKQKNFVLFVFETGEHDYLLCIEN